LYAVQLYGQQLPGVREKTFTTLTDTIFIDTLSIIPESFYIVDKKDSVVSKDYYSINFAKSFLILNNLPDTINLVTVYYRVFPVNFSKEYYHKDFDLIRGKTLQKIPDLDYYKEDDFSFGSSELNKSGSISRGLSFGNQQDAILNSNLNLQLSGKLNRDLNISAAISDANIPIQPDGSSQQIQEFDKVFIQIYNDKTDLIAGDFELANPYGYYFKLNKKAKGAYYSTQWQSKSEKYKYSSTLSGAVSKGKYCRKKLAVTEGNQGPYRLQGCDNENHIIILSGTEKVYMDGKLLMRGQENDYVINYNTAEIIFTPEQLITKDKRIIVEFEYSEQNYTRFLLFNSNEISSEKSRFYINLYNESDSKNQTLNIDLNEDQKQFLNNTGDDIEHAFYPNVYEDSIYDQNYIYYRIKDSVINYTSGTTIYYDSIYAYTTDPELAKYRLGFSFIGENEGNYVLTETNVNGKVYKWVAPDEDGTKSGSYEPVILLVTPKKKQLLSIGGETKLKLFDLGYELAVSNNDINTFSKLNTGDNAGYALKINAVNKSIAINRSTLSFGANYEFNDRNFSPVERFRPAEFERDWNIVDQETISQHLASVFADFKQDKSLTMHFQSSYINRQEKYAANRNEILMDYRKSGNKLYYKSSYVNTLTELNKTAFFRHNAEAATTLKNISLGIINELENNRWKDKETDSLQMNSFSFNQWEAYLKNADSVAMNYYLSYKTRQDYMPTFMKNNLALTTRGEDLNLGLIIAKNPARTLKTTFTYRKLSIKDTSLTDENEDRSLLARVESNLKFFNGSISSSTMYEVGSGLESVKEYAFVEVDRGLGIYIWNDYNNNSVQELEEFEIATYRDTANYIRIHLPGDYVKVYNTSFNQVLNLRPLKKWYSTKGVLKFFSRFSDQFAYRINAKTKADDLVKNINPFQTNALNDEIVSLSYSLKNTVFFNRTNPVFGMHYSINKNSRKDLLLSGYNTQENLINDLRLRWNLGKKITLGENFKIINKSYNSEAYPTKNYNLDEYENRLSVDYLPLLSLRISFVYSYKEKENTGSEKAEENNVGAEIKYNVKSKGNLVLQVNYLNLSFNGETNSPLAYEMLQGFMPGNNYTWTLQYQQQLANSLQLNLSYNGRQLPDSDALHAGGVQLRAFF